MDCSPPGSSVHGILQARILEWVAISFSRGSSQPRDWTCVSYLLHWQVHSLPLAPSGKTWEAKGLRIKSCHRISKPTSKLSASLLSSLKGGTALRDSLLEATLTVIKRTHWGFQWSLSFIQYCPKESNQYDMKKLLKYAWKCIFEFKLKVSRWNRNDKVVIYAVTDIETGLWSQRDPGLNLDIDLSWIG